ncbi:MAG: glycosyltransferase family 4 protein [Maritimibacter sp.]|nr:glycosyltransferase family 4 protein [Maritimibacter sp.]
MPPQYAPAVRFVTRKWPPAVGGMETYSKRLTDLLGARCDLDVIALPGRTDGSAPTPAQIVVFGARTFFALAFARPPVDVTHVGDMASWPLGLAARMRSRRTQVVLSAHGTDVSYPARGGLKGRLYGAYLALAHRLLPGAIVLANSGATARAVQGIGFDDVRIVPLAADALFAGPAPLPGPTLLFAGRLVRRKGLAWFVENVLPLLPDTLRLEVAGTVWDEAEGAALKHPRVKFLGPLPQDALGMKYAGALCVVVPNIDTEIGEFEGFGLVATEAAASGAVVLASAIDGLCEALVDGETGFHLPAGDARAWAEKIAEVAGWDPAERARFLETAQAVSRTRYAWARVAEETFAAYPRAGTAQ